MNDRELLELAAKAADKAGLICIAEMKRWCSDIAEFWNPLTDDGDALRLAVTLGFQIDINDCGITTVADGDIFENCADDPYAATRRAIVRAAAEIGKTQ